jgi:integrase
MDYFHRKTVKRLGFNFRLYDCRHTFATRVLETGIDLINACLAFGARELKNGNEIRTPIRRKKG